MAMLTSMQAAEEFEDLIPVFREAWQRSWADIISRFNEPGWDNSCRSHVTQMMAVVHARQMLHGTAGVEYRTFDNRHIFLVRDKGLFHLKLLDQNHCSSSYATPAAINFDNQSTLAGFDDYQRLTVGLIPKPDWTGFVGIYMTFPKGHRQKPNWVLDITGEPVDIESLQNEFNESVSQPERRFVPRRKSDKRAGEA